MQEKRRYEPLKYVFSKDEIRDLGEALAREAQAQMDLHAQKKSSASGYAAQIAENEKRMAELAKKINNGYELREVECMVMMETPRPGMKRIIRIDTNEAIFDEPMTAEEMQGNFGFQAGDDPREP